MSTSFPLKYLLRQRQELAWKSLPRASGRCGRMPLLARCNSIRSSSSSSSSSWNVKLWWTAILPIRSDLPHSDRIYISRHSIPPLYLFLFNPPSLYPRDIFRYRDSDLMRFYEPTMRPPYLTPRIPSRPCAMLHHVALLSHRIVVVHPTFRIISLAFPSVKCTPILFRPRGAASFSKRVFLPLSLLHKFFEILCPYTVSL